MNKLVFLTTLVSVLYLLSAPYIVLYQMKLAVESEDGASLSEHVDFESVRDHLKGQFKSEVISSSVGSNDAASLAGMALGALFVDKVIDGVVTSSTLIALMSGESEDSKGKGNSSKSTPSNFVPGSFGYESPSKFIFEVQNDDGESVEFTLRRRGITWQLTEVDLPLDQLTKN